MKGYGEQWNFEGRKSACFVTALEIRPGVRLSASFLGSASHGDGWPLWMVWCHLILEDPVALDMLTKRLCSVSSLPPAVGEVAEFIVGLGGLQRPAESGGLFQCHRPGSGRGGLRSRLRAPNPVPFPLLQSCCHPNVTLMENLHSR